VLGSASDMINIRHDWYDCWAHNTARHGPSIIAQPLRSATLRGESGVCGGSIQAIGGAGFTVDCSALPCLILVSLLTLQRFHIAAKFSSFALPLALSYTVSEWLIFFL
jgi:hypothetical protein